MSYSVPFVDPKEHYRRMKREIDRAIIGCLSNGDMIYRQQLHDFEANLAKFVGVEYAVGVNSGYHALEFSLRATGIGPGHEVITVAHTFVATVSAIVNVGARPVLVDVTADFNIDPAMIERAVTPRTRALLPVHLNGRVCDMEPIMCLAKKYNLVVIEDAAQSLGGSYKGRGAGSFGAAGCFSFYPFKVLGGFGDGGAITTNDPHVARVATLLRYNGEDRVTGEYHYHGQTALLDNVQAAVLDVKLRHLPEWIEHRRRIAALYRRELKDIPQITLPHFDESNRLDIYQNYVIRAKERDCLREHLKQQGIETLVSWPKPMWEHRDLRIPDQPLPETVRICQEVVSLPMSAETTEEHVRITAGAVRDFYSRSV